jgi:hypothetical protein
MFPRPLPHPLSVSGTNEAGVSSGNAGRPGTGSIICVSNNPPPPATTPTNTPPVQPPTQPKQVEVPKTPDRKCQPGSSSVGS